MTMWLAGHTREDSRPAPSSTMQVRVRASKRHPRIGLAQACPRRSRRYEMAEFVSNYGIWIVVAFVALESVGIPLPAEAALIAAAFFAARNHGIDIWALITAAIVAAIFGEIVGFWIGRRFGHQLLMRYGTHLGMNEGRIRIGQLLFLRYGGRFVFIARFLPFLRNMAATLAGANAMPRPLFYAASSAAAVAWVMIYSLASYALGEAFADLASSAAIALGIVAI